MGFKCRKRKGQKQARRVVDNKRGEEGLCRESQIYTNAYVHDQTGELFGIISAADSSARAMG